MKLRFEKGALDDFRVGYFYYDKISADLSQRFYSEFWDTIETIKSNPLYYQKKYRDIRITFLRNFPFGVHYISNDIEITVFRILHTSRFFK